VKKLITVLALSCAAMSVAAQATDEKKPTAPTAQQKKMTTCNKEAGEKGLAGDERKAFMKTCLSAKPSQQDKMKACNKEAGDKKGDERKKFMSECLKA
jgi:hypothetical protein